jgi:hypothetical protein
MANEKCEKCGEKAVRRKLHGDTEDWDEEFLCAECAVDGSKTDELPFVRVQPTSRGSFDSTTYPWEQLEDAFADVEATLDLEDGKEVKIVTIFMTQAEFDALPKEDEA